MLSARRPKRKRAKRDTLATARRKSERNARIDWILDAALDIAVQDGLGAVTITRLAEHLGYTAGAFYRYFPSIEALLAELHRHTAALFYGSFFDMLGRARQKLAAAQPDARALAEIVLLPAIYRKVADAHPKHFELVHQLVTKPALWLDAERRDAVMQIVLPRVVELVGIMSHAAADTKALSDGNAAVRLMTLWLSVHAALAVGPLAREHPDWFDRDVLVAEATRTLLLGWGASPAALDAAEKQIATCTRD